MNLSKQKLLLKLVRTYLSLSYHSSSTVYLKAAMDDIGTVLKVLESKSGLEVFCSMLDESNKKYERIINGEFTTIYCENVVVDFNSCGKMISRSYRKEAA